jgi:hypothetical protein
MKKVFSIVLFFISIGNSFGQITFIKSYQGISTIDDEGSSMDQAFDGGYIIAGTTNFTSLSSQDLILVKTNSFGDTSWIKTFGGANEDYGYGVTQTSDSGFVITGNMHLPGNNYHALLIKTDVNGNTLWSKLFRASGYNDYGYSVTSTIDGGLIVTGLRINLTTFQQSIFLIKTDNNGDTLWTRSFGQGAANYIEQTNDSGFIICGHTSFGLNADVYLIKTDVNGIPVWAKAYGGNWDDAGNEVHQTTDGGYIICGYSELTPRIYLVKTDSNGDTLWTKMYGGPDADQAFSIRQTIDGGYVVAGFSVDTFSQYLDLIKTDSNGNILWVKATYAGDEFFSVRQTTDGGYIIGTTLGSSTGWVLGLIKTDSSGNAGCNQINYSLNPIPMTTHVTNSPVVPDTNITIVTIPNLIETTGGNFSILCFSNGVPENIQTQSVITISPNPTTNNFTITFPNTINKASIEIYNVLGKKIFEESIFAVTQKEIHLKSINAGIYFVKVKDEKKEKEYCEKLVIEN